MPPRLLSPTAAGRNRSGRKRYQLDLSHAVPGPRPGHVGGAHTPQGGLPLGKAISLAAGSDRCPVSQCAPGSGPEIASPIRIDRLEPNPWAEISVEATPEDYEALRADIEAEGVRHPLVVWARGGRLLVVAGLTRLAVARDLGFETVPAVVRDFPDEWAAKIFGLVDNLARKHLSVAQRAYLALQYQKLLSVGSGRRTDLQPSTFLTKVDSRAEAAKRAGISVGSLSAVKAVVDCGDSDLLHRVLRGETPLHAAKAAANRLQSGDSGDERYSPPWLLEAVREVMGGIDMDPATSEAANRTVQAAKIYTRSANGLAKPWAGRVYLNPPFGMGLRVWVEHLAAEIRAGRVEQAFTIGPTDMPTHLGSPWFGVLIAGCLFLPHKRIEFLDPETGRWTGPRFGTFCSYWGPRRDLFVRVFGPKGTILQPAEVPDQDRHDEDRSYGKAQVPESAGTCLLHSPGRDPEEPPRTRSAADGESNNIRIDCSEDEYVEIDG